MNKRKTKVAIGMAIVGFVYHIAICIHYGFHWMPESIGETIHESTAGILSGFGVAIILIQYIRGGEENKKIE